ncbi:unnamed protein product [Strongylus vulgaris]|uniref:Peptidase A2 domain-containing protein n=1 Tax=Strongylus vulgaris TaxID=40348 RepID=A0A3P7IL80_STRVU|nr:unnamed protein product [Strongylus vulgaris]
MRTHIGSMQMRFCLYNHMNWILIQRVANLQKLFAPKKILDPTLKVRHDSPTDSHADDTPLTIEDLLNEFENFTALEMDNMDMEGTREIHALWKEKDASGQKKRRKTGQLYGRRRQCKTDVAFDAKKSRTYLDVVINRYSLHFQLDTGADITLISRRSWKSIGLSTLEPTIILENGRRNADGDRW